MNKTILCFLAVFIFSVIHAYAQAVNDNAAEEEVKKMEIIWMTALSKKDSVVLDQSMGASFELSKIGGNAETNISRDQWIKNALVMDWSRFAFTRMQIKVDSDLAIVNANLSFHLKPYPFKLSSGIVDVWRKSNGKWTVQKRYLSDDNLSNWLLILSGAALGIAFMVVLRWLKRAFSKHRHTT